MFGNVVENQILLKIKAGLFYIARAHKTSLFSFHLDKTAIRLEHLALLLPRLCRLSAVHSQYEVLLLKTRQDIHHGVDHIGFQVCFTKNMAKWFELVQIWYPLAALRLSQLYIL